MTSRPETQGKVLFLFSRGWRYPQESSRRPIGFANALWALQWYTMTSYPAGVPFAADRLATYFTELGLA